MTEQHNAHEFITELNDVEEQDVFSSIAKMDAEECKDFVRDFLDLMQKWQPEAINLEEDSMHGAAISLYLARLFPEAFRKAYCHVNEIVQAKHSLEDIFKK